MVKAMEIIIDGVECRGKAGETVLDVARAHGFGIPTLCHHAGLKPYGACRLCLVEVIRGDQSDCRVRALFRWPLDWSYTLPAKPS